MLPTPVTFAARRPFRRNGGPLHTRQHTLDTLFARARVTNLAVLLLGFFACISFFVNVSYYFFDPPTRGGHPSSIVATIARAKSLQGVTHLILVPGHAIWHGMDAASRLDEKEWVLEPYQRNSGRVKTFIQHITRGAELARADEHALLVFSGGQTRASSTMTEAESYLRLALNANLLHDAAPSAHFLRATTENYALDSYQNLLFSIARFHQYVGRWPSKVTVVGYEMKRARFTELHRAAIRWPKAAFHYIGIDPPEATSTQAQEGERLNGYIPYTKDLYGCHSELLSKRRSRNPYARFHSYLTSTPELTGILEYCPTESARLFPGPLPWT